MVFSFKDKGERKHVGEKKIPKGLNFERLIPSAEGVVSKIIESF